VRLKANRRFRAAIRLSRAERRVLARASSFAVSAEDIGLDGYTIRLR
jgi:hypothetical protein